MQIVYGDIYTYMNKGALVVPIARTNPTFTVGVAGGLSKHFPDTNWPLVYDSGKGRESLTLLVRDKLLASRRAVLLAPIRETPDAAPDLVLIYKVCIEIRDLLEEYAHAYDRVFMPILGAGGPKGLETYTVLQVITEVIGNLSNVTIVVRPQLSQPLCWKPYGDRAIFDGTVWDMFRALGIVNERIDSLVVDHIVGDDTYRVYTKQAGTIAYATVKPNTDPPSDRWLVSLTGNKMEGQSVEELIPFLPLPYKYFAKNQFYLVYAGTRDRVHKFEVRNKMVDSTVGYIYGKNG